MYINYVWRHGERNIKCHDGLAVVYAVHSNCSCEIDPALLFEFLHGWVFANWIIVMYF